MKTESPLPLLGLLSLAVLAAACQPLDEGSVPASGIDAESLLAHIRTLSSDEFEGRAPGSPGGERTVEYLTEQFRQLGLASGNPDGTYLQAVPLVGITPQPGGALELGDGDRSTTLEPGADYVAYTKRVVDEVEMEGELVFVGYGAVAPEYEWNDFKDEDVSGKVLLMLVNDPPGPDIFGGRAMTYYGRWTYKFEMAAERGAAGAFVIHETGPAGYPWEVIGSSPYGEQFDLVTADRNMGRASVEGWIQRAAAESIFEMAGLDFEQHKRAATERDFTPVSLGITARTRITNTLRTVDSNNVVARIEGREAPDELLVYVRPLGSPRSGRGSRGGSDLQRRARQCERHRRPAGARGRVQPHRRSAPTEHPLSRRHRRGAGAARLAILRRTAALPAGPDGRRDQHGRPQPAGRHA